MSLTNITTMPIQYVFHPIYSQLNLPVRHRFPIEKYQGIRDALASQRADDKLFHLPEPISIQQLNQFLEPEYVEQFCTGTLDPKAMRRIGFPWSEQLVLRSRTAVGGTLLTADLAYDNGIALNLTGGYHHGFYNFGSGFCIFNDLYLAACHLLKRPEIERVLIFDCDVHQGDGTALLAQDNPNIYTVSLHGEKNFPHRKQVSDMDFGLAKHTKDDEYLEVVEEALHLAFMHSNPDMVIYDAGVDIHIDDDLGHLDITTEGVYRRDRMVLSQCKSKGIPVMAVIGGGYQRDIDALVKVHMQLFNAAGDLY